MSEQFEGPSPKLRQKSWKRVKSSEYGTKCEFADFSLLQSFFSFFLHSLEFFFWFIFFCFKTKENEHKSICCLILISYLINYNINTTYSAMKKLILFSAILSLLLMFDFDVMAQPGGPGGFPGGGRSPMGQFPGGRPGGNRPNFNNSADDQKASTVRQKKKVREGSTFKVVGSLRDSVTGEFLPYVNVSILDSVDSTFVKGASTNMDGYFEISDIHAGGYFLRV